MWNSHSTHLICSSVVVWFNITFLPITSFCRFTFVVVPPAGMKLVNTNLKQKKLNALFTQILACLLLDFRIRLKSDLWDYLVTFVANATVVMSSLAVLLEVVGHVGGTQELATHLAGDLVLMASKVRPQSIPSSKRCITNLKHWTKMLADHSGPYTMKQDFKLI